MEDEKLTILIIEHDLPASDLISLALKRASYYTFRAYDGRSGWELICSQDPDLIFLDLPVTMEPNSFDLCDQLKSRKSIIPVIGAVQENETDLADAMDLNYIVKPFSIHDFKRKSRKRFFDLIYPLFQKSKRWAVLPLISGGAQ